MNSERLNAVLLVKAQTGSKCADERSWPLQYVPPGGFDPDPLVNERKSRRLIIHDLVYLADKGFVILDLLMEFDAKLWKPVTRAKKQKQLTENELYTGVKCGRERIHVERANRRGRESAIMNKRVPLSHLDLASDEVFIAMMMQNFQAPLTRKNAFE
jgi:hypothetical protein